MNQVPTVTMETSKIRQQEGLEPLLVRLAEDGEAVDMSVTWVSERLRLLSLPEAARWQHMGNRRH